MGSKFGYHHLGQPDATTLFLERRTPFAWRKQCSPGGDNPTPHIKTIGRSLKLTDGQANAMIQKGAAGAEEWYNVVRGEMLAAPWVWCWEGPNEPPVGTRLQCINLGNFTRRAVDMMHGDGLKVATGVFSRGTPQLAAANPTECYLRELAPCFSYGDYVALHAYWVKNPAQDALWLQFRHRFLLAELAALGITCKQICITEGGLDNPGGYKSCGVSEADYWTQLRDYDLAIENDKQVLCWTPYTNQPTHDWEAFEITSWLTAKIAAEVRARPPQQEVSMPEPPTIVLICPIRPTPFITQEFGSNDVSYPPPGHPGTDYRAAEGTVIRAPCAGEAHIGNPLGGYKAYGIHLWIKGKDSDGRTFWLILAHLSRILVDEHEMVQPGNIVALSGNTGRSTGPHLHLGVETLDVNPGYQDRIDPEYYWHDPETFMQTS